MCKHHSYPEERVPLNDSFSERHIGLLPIIREVMESITAADLRHYLFSNSLISDNEYKTFIKSFMEYGTPLDFLLSTLLLLRELKPRTSTPLVSQGKRRVPKDCHSPTGSKLLGCLRVASLHIAPPALFSSHSLSLCTSSALILV